MLERCRPHRLSTLSSACQARFAPAGQNFTRLQHVDAVSAVNADGEGLASSHPPAGLKTDRSEGSSRSNSSLPLVFTKLRKKNVSQATISYVQKNQHGQSWLSTLPGGKEIERNDPLWRKGTEMGKRVQLTIDAVSEETARLSGFWKRFLHKDSPRPISQEQLQEQQYSIAELIDGFQTFLRLSELPRARQEHSYNGAKDLATCCRKALVFIREIDRCIDELEQGDKDKAAELEEDFGNAVTGLRICVQVSAIKSKEIFRSVALDLSHARNIPPLVHSGQRDSSMQDFDDLISDVTSTSAEQDQYGQGRTSGMVRLGEKRQWSFPAIFLRDACSCPKCVDASSGQKNFQTHEIPAEIAADQVVDVVDPNWTGTESYRILWRNDIPGFEDHTSEFTKGWAKSASDLDALIQQMSRPAVWGRESFRIPTVTYDLWMSNDDRVYQTLRNIRRYGLVKVIGVPDAETAVEDVGQRIGPLKNTFYGKTWNVKSIPDAKNVAYTHQNLGYHMDLLYMEQPPGLQLLHCLKNSTTGGASLFADSFRALEIMSDQSPRLYEALLYFPVTFHYTKDGHYYNQTRKTIEPYPVSDVVPNRRPTRRWQHVNWSPPFQAPLLHSMVRTVTGNGIDIAEYLQAAKEFARLLEEEAATFETRAQPGECFIFDNRRIVHARRAFDNLSGERHLKGAYLDEDVFISKLRVLGRKNHPGFVPQGVGSIVAPS